MTASDFISVLAAILLGAILGLEREYNGKPAGIRTHILICVGAAIFTLISINLSKISGGDASRIVAQIVTGVGFIGAGAIIQDRGGVYGLTSAAAIWLAAAVGVACGVKLYLLAVTAAVTATVVLSGLGRAEQAIKKFKRKNRKKQEEKSSDTK
jgi:putative Mg2+ transporter-C (MgtC) family protein